MSSVNCREFENSLIEMARNGPLDQDERARVAAHVEICRSCSAMLNSQRRLHAAAGVLAADATQFSMPALAERVLLAEFDAARAVRRPRPLQSRRFVYGVLGGALAASLAMVWWLADRPAPRLQVRTKAPVVAITPAQTQPVQPTLAAMESLPRRHIRRAVQPAAASEQPFIAIPYTLPLEVWEHTDVVRMDLPVAALVAAGLPMSMVDPTAQARTDVLVGQDGRARAVRLISLSIPN